MPLTYIKNNSIAPNNEFNLSLKMTNHSKLLQIYLRASALKETRPFFSDHLQSFRNIMKSSDCSGWE